MMEINQENKSKTITTVNNAITEMKAVQFVARLHLE